MKSFNERYGEKQLLLEQIADERDEIANGFRRAIQMLRDIQDKKVKINSLIIKDDGWDIKDG